MDNLANNETNGGQKKLLILGSQPRINIYCAVVVMVQRSVRAKSIIPLKNSSGVKKSELNGFDKIEV
jgi:hypothetical protein